MAALRMLIQPADRLRLAGKRLMPFPIRDNQHENPGGVGKGRFVDPKLTVADGSFAVSRMPGYDKRRGLLAATPIVLPHGVGGCESSTRTREHSTQERLPQSSPTVGPRRLPRPRMQWSPGTRSQSRAGNRAPYKAAATSVLGGAARILPETPIRNTTEKAPQTAQ